MSAPDLQHRLSAKSDRLLRLTASCIKAAVRLRFHHEIPWDDAVDLARRHDIHSAIKSLSSKLQVHESLPDTVKFGVAVSEAKLSDAVTGEESVKHVIKVRTAAVGPGISSVQTPKQREALINGLLAIRKDATRWAHEYKRFTEDIIQIYADAVQQLGELSLPAEIRSEALTQLESILAKAGKRASEQ